MNISRRKCEEVLAVAILTTKSLCMTAYVPTTTSVRYSDADIWLIHVVQMSVLGGCYSVARRLQRCSGWSLDSC